MTSWPSSKANRVLAALYRIGWSLKRQSGSHKTLSRIAKHTGLKPEDL